MNRTLLIVAVALAILAGGYVIASAYDPPHTDYRGDPSTLGAGGYPYASVGCTGNGAACHPYTKDRFLPGNLDASSANNFTNFCLTCHNATGEAHEKSAGSPSNNVYNNLTGLLPGNTGNSHSWNGSIGNAGTRVPTNSGFSGTAHMPGGKVRCQTCHDGMSTKTDVEENINWRQATNPSSDLKNYVLSGVSGTKQYLARYIKVYRSANAMSQPTESRARKNYLVNYTAYNYNYQNATITFNRAQGSTVNIYADIGEPYLRVGNAASNICVDCHNDRLDRAVAHEPGTGARDGHPVMVPFANRSGLHATLKGSADNNIFIEGGKVVCTSCHDPHNAAGADGMILRNADTSALCTNCHKVNGYDGYSTEMLSMHNGSKHTGPTVCTDCHTTNNSNNIMLIKNKINGVAVNFQNFSGANNFVNGSGTGLCQVCHSATGHYLADGSGQDHNPGRNCLACHGHGTGFTPAGGSSCDACHGFPPAPGNAGPSGWADTTGNLHGSHMAHLNTAPFGYLTGTAACARCHGSVPRGDHNTNKNTAGIDTSTWGGGTFDGGTMIGKSDTTDDSCSNVSCHNTGGTRNWGSSGGCGTCHPFPGSGNDWPAGNGHAVRADGVTNIHMIASGYDADNPDEYAIVTADPTRCGKCHPNNPNHHSGTIALNANGYAACYGVNFSINQTVTGSNVTCDNVSCHKGKTTPNWW